MCPLPWQLTGSRLHPCSQRKTQARCCISAAESPANLSRHRRQIFAVRCLGWVVSLCAQARVLCAAGGEKGDAGQVRLGLAPCGWTAMAESVQRRSESRAAGGCCPAAGPVLRSWAPAPGPLSWPSPCPARCPAGGSRSVRGAGSAAAAR